MAGHGDAGRVKRWRELLASERDAAALYGRIAEGETGERRKIFEELAAVERRHAAHWGDTLRKAGAAVPPPGRPGLRPRLLALGTRRLSSNAVLPLIERAERADAGVHDRDPDAALGMAADEHGHARTIVKLIEGGRPDPRTQIARREPLAPQGPFRCATNGRVEPSGCVAYENPIFCPNGESGGHRPCEEVGRGAPLVPPRTRG